MQRLEGNRILVTGAASGIGQATALRLLDEGARVVAADIAGLDDTRAEAEKAATAAPYVAVSQAAASELATLQVADQATALRLEVAKTVEMPQILHVAKVPDSPSGPSRTLNVAAGALAGLVVGVIVAFVRRRVRGA